MNDLYVVITIACFGLGIGIFLCLYVLERPVYSTVLGGRTDQKSRNQDVIKISSILNQYADHGIPIVMASQMLVGIACSILLVLYHTHTFFNLLVLLIACMMVLLSAIFVPAAVKKLRAFSLSGEDTSLLAPIFRAHMYGGIVLVVIVLLQVLGVVLGSTGALPNAFIYQAWLS